MSRTLRRASVLAVPALALALLPLTGLSAADAAKPVATTATTSAKLATSGGGGPLWTPTSVEPQANRNGNRRTVNPSDYRGYTLDGQALRATLATAPLEGSRAARAGRAVEVVMPAPTGELMTYAVVESPVMEARLQAKHPEIRTYAGRDTKGFGESIRFDVTPQGVHVAVRAPSHPSWYVDPAYLGDDSLYLSYFGQDLPTDEHQLVEPQLDKVTKDRVTKAVPRVGEGPNGIVKQRVYRLALLTDPSYANYVAPGLNDGTQDAASNAAVLSAKVTLMNRVNEIYNDDLAVKMVLINGTDALNLNTNAKAITAGGSCGAAPCFAAGGTGSLANGCTSPLLTRQRHVIGLLAGARNFDIGHLALGINGGGIAGLGVVGGNNKAQGCTGLPFPVGDFMAIDYVAHEMGHQFAGNHTFTSPTLCGAGNRSAATSVEPGGGSSVMAYAGICGADDLQDHSDPYFSQRTQTEVSTYINGTPSAPNEVQEFAFNGFDTTKSFTLTFNGVTTLPITGTTTVAGTSYAYTAAGIKAAVESVTGGTVTVSGLYATGTPSTTGFQITFSGTLAATNVANGTITPTGFTAFGNDITQGGADTRGGSVVTTSNRNPVVTAAPAKSIPVRTPFTLTGSATDSDGDALNYLWEQNDRGTATGIALVDNAKANGPLFRVFGTYADVSLANSLLYHSPGENLATNNPSRTFPDMAQVLAGTTNAATGTCPTVTGTATVPPGATLDCYSEFLPTSAYVGSTLAPNAEPSLNFRLTARDMRANGGGTSFADTKLTIVSTAGPFAVTSQPTATSYDGGSTLPVTWAVNGTNIPTLAPNVKISLSTDGGLSFPTVLAASTPNDGNESVVLPNVGTSTARIKVEAVDNYFFDVNDAAFTIVGQITNQTPPSISGTPTPGSPLTATPGTYTPSDVTLSYQWFANGVAIAGATGQTFTPGPAEEGKLVVVREVASKPLFASTAAVSQPVRIVTQGIVNLSPPAITGTPVTGQTLTVSDGAWNYPDLTFTYQWYSNGVAIRGQRSNTYVIAPSQAGKTITARVTAVRPGSDAVVAVSNAVNVS